MNSSSSNGEQESQREEESNPIDEENDPALARSEYEENYQNKGKPQLNGHQSKKGLNASDLELNDLEMRGLEEEEMFLRLVRDQREKVPFYLAYYGLNPKNRWSELRMILTGKKGF